MSTTPPLPMPTCEVCQQHEAVGVASVPGIPYSAAYCKTCLEREADPFFVIRANVAACGGPAQVRSSILETVTYVDGRYMTLREGLELHPLTEEELRGEP